MLKLYHTKLLVLIISSLLSLGFISNTIAATTETSKTTMRFKPQKIGSRLALANLLMSHHTNRYLYRAYDDILVASANDTITANTSSNTVSHSDTTVQVQGVDEADTVKVSDDGYIYQIYNNQVRIIKAFPLAELNQTASIDFPDSNFYPSGLYSQQGKLVIIGTAWQNLVQSHKPIISYGWWGWWNQYSQTRALVYDMSDQSQPKLERDLAIDGDYLDSRRIANTLYFVTRTYPRYYMYGALDTTMAMKPANMLPTISDKQAGKNTKKLLALKDITYFPDFVEPDYVVVASINLQQPAEEAITKAYLGAGEIVYASTKNLYLSASNYSFNTDPNTANTTISTRIFKFAIQNGQIDFASAGEVAGTVLNQFSMDEQGDYFRIATTTQSWFSDSSQSHNSLFVLNNAMKTVGKLENLAAGEQVYATRFLGDRCYIVTFRLVDPLFAIDLSNPQQPTVMGELKIPGYSNYLHPYDATHLIGFGKDAAVYNSEQVNSDQFWAGGSAFYQGLKLALFDVADMKNPKELYSITIGDRGTNSPLLWTHKALYWDSEQHLFGFPVEVYQLAQGFDATQPWLYGLPSYQGAYVYQVTPEAGFTLKAKLSQIPDTITPHYENYYGYSYGYWDTTAYNLFIDRLLRIDSNLYTLSNSQVNVYDLVNYQEQSILTLKP